VNAAISPQKSRERRFWGTYDPQNFQARHEAREPNLLLAVLQVLGLAQGLRQLHQVRHVAPLGVLRVDRRVVLEDVHDAVQPPDEVGLVGQK
jgi:hypothetical protein